MPPYAHAAWQDASSNKHNVEVMQMQRLVEGMGLPWLETCWHAPRGLLDSRLSVHCLPNNFCLTSLLATFVRRNPVAITSWQHPWRQVIAAAWSFSCLLRWTTRQVERENFKSSVLASQPQQEKPGWSTGARKIWMVYSN